MLVSFSFSNYKCFKDRATLSLVAEKKQNTLNYYKTKHKYSVLKATAVYGANASGKTKLFEAMQFLKCIICPPLVNEKIPAFDFWSTEYDAFRLNTQSEQQTSKFEIIFIIEDIQYRYEIEIDKNRIISEALFSKNKREEDTFSRVNDKIKYTKSHIKEEIADNLIKSNMISDKASFITVLKTFNEPLATKIYNWFNSIKVISPNKISDFDWRALNDSNRKSLILKFLRSFDFNIEDIRPHEVPTDALPDKIKQLIGVENIPGKTFCDDINISHKKYNENYERLNDDEVFSLFKDESFGTNRLFTIVLPLFSSIANNSVLLIDEFDSGFHTLLLHKIIGLFYHLSESAQLVINVHNTSLLDAKIFGAGKDKLFNKDQIYFVNKNRYGESTLTALTDYEGDLRSSIEKKYLEGELSATPNINTDKFIADAKR